MSRKKTGALSIAAATVCRFSAICVWIWWGVFLILLFQFAPVLCLIAGCYRLYRSRQMSSDVDASHGSARWADLPDLQRAGCVFNEDGIPAGKTLNLPAAPLSARILALLTYPVSRSAEAVAVAATGSARQPLQINIPDHYPHISVFGASGSGKSTCVSVPMLQACADNMVILDPKGELCRITARLRAERFGHHIIVLDPYGVSEGCGFERSCLNPLSLFRENEGRVVDEARRLAEALVVRTGNEPERFWNDAAETVLTATNAFLMSSALPEEATLNRLRDILSNPELIEQMLEFMKQSDACSGLLQRLAGQVAQAQGNTKSSIASVANAHVAFLDNLSIAQTVAATTFDPRELVTGRISIFLCLPVDRLTSLASLQRVMLSTLINLVFEAGENSARRVRFLLDEAATLGPMESLYAMIMFGRSFGLRSTLLFQSMSQVERCFPESQAHDYRATVATVATGVNDFQSAKHLSDWIGNTTVHSTTVANGQNSGESHTSGINDQSHGSNQGWNASTSLATTGRSLLQPEEILQLPRQLSLILLPHTPPILAEKTPYYQKARKPWLRSFFRFVRDVAVIVLTLAMIPMVWEVITSNQMASLRLELVARLQQMQ